MPKDELKQRILELVNHDNYVSFAELARLPGFNGDRSIRHADHPNLFLWNGVSQEGVDAVSELLASRQAHLRPAQLLIYMVDSADFEILNWPRAAKVRDYATPHWFPATLCKGPR